MSTPATLGHANGSRSTAQVVFRTLKRQPNLFVGLILLLIVLSAAVLAPLIMTHDPTFQNPIERLKPPFGEYIFGTDGQGRDIYSRVLRGAQTSLFVGAAVATGTVIIGTVIGLVSGTMPKADRVIMRIMDGMMAFPGIILAIGIMAVRGPAVSNVIIALITVSTPVMARIVRSVVLGTSRSLFVESAESIGASQSRVLFLHVLPNCLSPIIVQASIVFAEAVLAEATLSFLGAGAPVGTPTWGGMLSDSRVFLSHSPWTMLIPGAALTITVFALNLMGDGIRDLLDPKLRQR